MRACLFSISVSWGLAAAFERFTAQFGSWWPSRTFVDRRRSNQTGRFRARTRRRIYEEHRDGRRFQWGQVLVWEPPSRVKFIWRPSRGAAAVQEVEIEFRAEGSGTRVKLTSGGWENWGPKAERARKGCGSGWTYVLNVWAGWRTAGMFMMDGMIGLMNVVQKFRGGRDAVIARAEGEIS